MIQTLPSASLAVLDTWPSVHPFGMCGHDGSTSNFGTSRVDVALCCAPVSLCDPEITSAVTATKATPPPTLSLRFIFTNLSSSYKIDSHCSGFFLPPVSGSKFLTGHRSASLENHSSYKGKGRPNFARFCIGSAMSLTARRFDHCA